MTEIFSFLVQHLIVVAAFILAVMLFTHVFRRQERSNTSIAWILAIILVPYLGVPAYLLFGDRKLRRLSRRKEKIYGLSSEPISGSQPSRPRINRLLASYGLPKSRSGNEIQLIDSNDKAYAQLIDLIQASETSIHLMTFIFSVDEVGREVADALVAKVREGVKVRLLVDGLGSFYARLSLLRKMERSGVEVGVFMRMLPLHRRWSANLRNHRKVAVFDGHTALVGGMNIGSEYMGIDQNEYHWIDTMTLVRGPIVGDFEDIFAHDWRFATEKNVEGIDDNFDGEIEAAGEMNAQVIASGPDVDGDPLYDLLIASIHNAENRIWITTPYFIPDYELVRALRLAARSGVDVRLLTPKRSNHVVADMARNRVLRKALKSGLNVYFEPEKMLHAKHIVIDHNFMLAGSANIDMRSLYFNYEVGLFSDSRSAVDATASWMLGLMEGCEKNVLPKQNFIRRWTEDICWLLTPIL